MSIWQFKITAQKDDAYTLSEILGAQADVMSLFENPENQFEWVVEGTCEQEPQRAILEELIATLEGTTPHVLDIIELPDKDWLADNRKDFQPLEIAGFYIYGSHIEDPQWGDKIPLMIDASTAFGTGNHGTTHGCLAALQNLKSQGITPKNPLDLGCGTGILALGIAKLFSVPVTASDIDPEAIAKTIYNAKENNEAAHISAIVAEGFDSENLASKAPFDLIVANILAGPLIDLAPQVKLALVPGAYLVLSGILDHQANAVKEAYVNSTLHLVQENCLDEWATLVFQKQ